MGSREEKARESQEKQKRQSKEAFRSKRIGKEDTWIQPFPLAALSLWSKAEMGKKSLLL